MRKWGYRDQDINCICGQEQTTSHLLVCPRGPSPCTEETRGTYNKQQEGGKYSHILDKRKNIIIMQCAYYLCALLVTIILVCYYYLYFTYLILTT
jgi:hypothetical protein